MMIIRACGAVIRDDRILMVRHIHNGRDYWTLPGGGVEPNETPEEAAVREVKEETGLDVEVKEPLFDEDFDGKRKACRCFLMTEVRSHQKASLGHDPEQSHIPAQDRILQDISWCTLDAMQHDKQVSKIITCLKIMLPL